MSMPTSRIAATASGRTAVGLTPALSTSKRAPPSWRSSPSAIWLRAELPVQRIRTRFGSDIGSASFFRSVARRGGDRRSVATKRRVALGRLAGRKVFSLLGRPRVVHDDFVRVARERGHEPAEEERGGGR